MILQLRKRHRRTFLALAIFLPLVLFIALAMRRPIPIDASTLQFSGKR